MAKKSRANKSGKKRKVALKQTDVPSFSLDEAIRVPTAILDNYAGAATIPLDVATALNMTPKSSQFKMLTGAAIAYGLTSGGAQADSIEITSLSKRILRPTSEGDDASARKEAFMQPRVIKEFLEKYDGNSLPSGQVATNVVEAFGVPRDRAEEVFNEIVSSAKDIGLIVTIKNKPYVRLSGIAARHNSDDSNVHSSSDDGSDILMPDSLPTNDASTLGHAIPAKTPIEAEDPRMKRVFITHGKNKTLVGPIKSFLSFGELVPVVSVEKESTSVPVPEKVMRDMRSCGAAIIHVSDEETLIDAEGNQKVVLNPNVLMEIGAAMALYNKRFILLVKEGVKLPSNMQGLYKVFYKGDELGHEGTMKLLNAIQELKKEPMG